MIEVWEGEPGVAWPRLYQSGAGVGRWTFSEFQRLLSQPESLEGVWEPVETYVSDVALEQPDVWGANFGAGGALIVSTEVRDAIEQDCHPFGWLEFLPINDVDAGVTNWLLHYLAWPNVVDESTSTYINFASTSIETLAIPEFHRERLAHQTLFPVARTKQRKGFRNCAFTDSDDPSSSSYVKSMIDERGFTGLDWHLIWNDVDGGMLIEERYERDLPG